MDKNNLFTQLVNPPKKTLDQISRISIQTINQSISQV